MKKQLTARQIEERKANILRWAAVRNNEVKYTATEIANALIAINALNTERRHASDVQVAANYLNAIAAHNMEVGDADVRNILAGAFKGNLTASDAATLGQFAFDEEIEL